MKVDSHGHVSGPDSKAGSVATGALTGAAAGGVTGSIAGPPGALAGALIGAAVGAAAGAVVDSAAQAEAAHDRELDDEIGVTKGNIGAASPDAPPARVGAFSCADDPTVTEFKQGRRATCCTQPPGPRIDSPSHRQRVSGFMAGDCAGWRCWVRRQRREQTSNATRR